MKPSKGGRRYTWIHTRGAMVERYKPWGLLIILSSAKLRCLVFQIIVIKKTKHIPCPHEYIYFKVLWNGLHTLYWIYNSYGIKPPPLDRSRRHCPTCLQNWRRGGGMTAIAIIMGLIPTRVGGGGIEHRREEEEVGYRGA